MAFDQFFLPDVQVISRKIYNLKKRTGGNIYPSSHASPTHRMPSWLASSMVNHWRRRTKSSLYLNNKCDLAYRLSTHNLKRVFKAMS